VVRSAIVQEPLFSPRANEMQEESAMMAQWAQMVQSTVDGTERALSVATDVASDAGRAMREREAAAEREKELSHEYLVREVETSKSQAARECEKAFDGRVATTKAEQEQASGLAEQRVKFENDVLDREARHREDQSARRDAEERWRLRRKEREEIAREQDRVERAQKEEAAALGKARRAEDLARAIAELDQAQRAREEALSRREAESEEQRRYRERREMELEASRREEAELADNMIGNLDRKFREQEETAVALRVAEASHVDRTAVEQESNTRTPFKAYRAREHLMAFEEVEKYEEQQAERDDAQRHLTEGDFERRQRAAYRLHRQNPTSPKGDDRSLRGQSKSYRYGGSHTGGPVPSGTDHETRCKLGKDHTTEYHSGLEAMYEHGDLTKLYDGAALTLPDAAGQARARPPLAHIHNEEEYDYAASAVGASGSFGPSGRPLVQRGIAEGRLFAGVQTPRQEMEEAREAKHTLKREEKNAKLEAAKARREQAEYVYSARTVHHAQLKSRHEQYLAEATPALAAAQAAAGSITPEEIAAILDHPNPAPVVQAVCASACILLTGDCLLTFPAARQFMNPPERFVSLLRDRRSEMAGENQVAEVQQVMRTLDADQVLGASPAAAALMMWTANVARYNQMYSRLGPVRMEMMQTAEELEKADVERREAAKAVSYLLAWKQ